ncbi:MAG: hypothetical protein ABJ239_12530 [Erythrobacter sp.]
MADIESIIEANELRFMQCWMRRDTSGIKQIAARDFMMVVGTNPPQLLDRPSFVAAMETEFRCTGFRMGESYSRRHGRTAWFVAGVQLELLLGAKEWKGDFVITDMWRKPRFGSWRMAERSLAQVESDGRFADSVKKLQLWT